MVNGSDPGTFRYQITAPDAETMDEWWRSVVTQTTTYGFKRLSADFYTYDKSYWYYAPSLVVEKLLYTVCNDWSKITNPIIVNTPRSDPISGRTFYVRSKSKPTVFWYVTAEGQGRIYASELGRTRFRISIDDEKDENETVMIGTDKITIAKASDPKLMVGVTNGELYLSGQAASFTYKDLKNRFLAQGETQFGGESRNVATVKMMDVGVGEEWEIVY